MWSFKLITWVILCTNIHLSLSATFDDIQQLTAYLRPKLEPNIRPVINQQDVINVTILPILRTLQDLDEKAQVLSISLALRLSWTCETLTWNESDFGGTKYVSFPPKDMWIPDLAYTNVVNDIIGMNQNDDMKVLLRSDGLTKWYTGSNIHTECSIDISKYPFDTQTCCIIIGKMFSIAREVVLLLSIEEHTDRTFFEVNDEWHLIDTRISLKSVNGKYQQIKMDLELRRRSLFYIINTIIPVLLLSSMNILSFKLPVTSGERIGYCISLLLTFVVFLNMISETMPRVSKSVSYFQLYIVTQLTLGVLITTISILFLHLVHTEQHGTITHFLFALCKKPKHQEEKQQQDKHDQQEKMGEDRQQEKSEKHTDSATTTIDNITLVCRLDKICLKIFSILFLISTLLCFVLMLI